jgi:dienelactone hydrolase
VRPRRTADRRSIVVVFGAVIACASALGGLAIRAATQQRLFPPEVQVQNDNYGEVRARFRTKLLRVGPSPQKELMQRPPDWVQVVDFPSGDLQLKAWMSGHEQRGPKLPAVLFLHGGFAFGPADWEMAVPYWAAGFVVMVPMLRGENGLPGTFSFLYDEVSDVLAAADYLSRQPSVAPDHIYLAGHSAGATLALLAAEASGRFRAVASFDGSPDQQLLYKGSASKSGVHPEVVFDPKELRELQVRSPLAYARSLRSPVRLYYSDEAAVLVHLPNDRLVEIAKGRGLDVAAINVRGSHFTHVAPAMRQSITFFKRGMDARSARLLKRREVPPQKPNLVGNTTFRLKGYPRAQVVTVAGSFNGWDSRHFLCGRDVAEWVCRIDLPAGKYYYQFVVDDDWILDPANPSREAPDGNMSSVLLK